MSESGEVRKLHGLEAVLAAAQYLSDEETKILQAALAWDVEDVETAKRRMEESEASQVWPEGSPERRLIERGGKEAVLRDIAAADEAREADAQEAINAVGDALDRIDAPQGATYAERIDRLYRELRGQISDVRTELTAIRFTVDKLRAEGKVKPGTKELVIVLEDVSDADQPPGYRFIELEDQDGAGVGGFGIKPSSRTPFLEITIPYGRDNAWVSEVAYQAAGAATRPLMEDHPDYVFPSERVSDAVAELLSDFGIPRACRDCAEEELGHGAKEVDARRDATIKQLEADVERFLGEREEARSGESRFAEERDCAFALLRWLLPVTVAKGLD